jgi:hypothetical protein
VVLATAIAALASAAPATANSNFVIELVVDGVSRSVSYRNIRDALDLVRDNGIRTLFPTYSAANNLVANLNLRGIEGTVTLPAGNGAATVSFPRAGVTRTFSGSTRADTQNQLRRFFEGGGTSATETSANQAALTQIVQTAVATTTGDPVAGHPLSLIGQMAAADHLAGLRTPGVPQGGAGFSGAIGAGYDRTSSAFGNQFLNLPLQAGYSFGQDRPEIFIDVPLSLAEQEGTRYYQGSVALGVRLPIVVDQGLRWTVTGAVRGGATGSDALGTGGYVVGGSLTSDLHVPLAAGFTLGVGNSLSYYESRPIDYGGVYVNYELQNQIWRNSLSLARPLGEVFGRSIHGLARVTDTRATGDEFFIPSWQEYTLAVTLPAATPITAGATWIDGRRDFTAIRFGISVGF